MPGNRSGGASPTRSTQGRRFDAGPSPGFTRTGSCRTREVDPPLPLAPSPRAVLAPIAASLAQLPWAKDDIRLHLRHRLPTSLRRLASPLAAELRAAFPGLSAPDAARLLAHLLASPLGQRIADHAARTGTRPASVLDPPAFQPLPALADLPLPRLSSPGDLAEFLALSPDQLIRFADLRGLSARSPTPFGGHYRIHLMPKPAGGLRLIEEPKPFLKKLQRRLLHSLLDAVPPHAAAHGFRKGRSCIGAAAAHAGEAMVACFDLADFFPTFGFARVYGLFRSLGYPAAVARDLAGLCTALTPPDILRGTPGLAGGPLTNRHLPQGAPTSPALANLMAFGLDSRLAGLARSLGARYTRYADDLTFSGDARIAPILSRVVPEIAAEEGFRLNPAKTRLQPAAQRQVVTGLTVNARVNIARPEYDRLKATLHHLANPADPRRADPAFLSSLHGRIGWVEQVNPHRGARLRLALATLALDEAR